MSQRDFRLIAHHFAAITSPADQIPPLFYPGEIGKDLLLTEKLFADWFQRYRPEVIVPANGMMKDWVEASGLRVPEDVAVVHTALDNDVLDWAGIHSKKRELGATAAEWVISMIQNHRFGLPEPPPRHARTRNMAAWNNSADSQGGKVSRLVFFESRCYPGFSPRLRLCGGLDSPAPLWNDAVQEVDMLRPILSVLVLFLVVPALRADSLDSGIPGIWIEFTVTSDFVENMVWIINDDGFFTNAIQHTPPGGVVNLNDNSSNDSTYTGTLTTSNGRYIFSFPDGSTNGGAYVLSDDQSKMLMKADDVANAYICQRYAIMTDNGANWSIMPVTTGGLLCLPPSMTKAENLNHYGPAHWVQPGLAGVWIENAPTAAQPNTKTAIWIIQPDGQSTLHVQNATSSQPLDPNSSAHDTATQIGFIDIFGGRFCVSSSDATGHDTGTYTLNGDQLNVTFDTGNGPASVFKRAGYFNLDGTVHLN